MKAVKMAECPCCTEGDGRVVFIVERGETGLWTITSPDVRGLYVAEKTMEDALDQLPGAMALLRMAARMMP